MTLFLEYCRLVGKDPNCYTLNEDRRKKAILRFRERVKANDGDWDAAAHDMYQAISNLASNEFLMKSTEEFERRLNCSRKGGDIHPQGSEQRRRLHRRPRTPAERQS